MSSTSKDKDAAEDTPPHGQILVYAAEDGRLKIDVRLEDESVWLTQQHMADLFQTTQQNISLHLQNIYEEGELQRAATHKEYLSVRQEGKRQVRRSLDFYNLDAIISVDYRVTSAVATRFRIWATQKLREYIVKGFVLDDERLKNPDQPFDYFEEQYLVFAEGQAMRRVPMHMSDWIAKLHGFLTLNDRAILTHAGKISHELAKELAETEYEKFHSAQIAQADQAGGDFDQAVKQLPPRTKKKRHTA